MGRRRTCGGTCPTGEGKKVETSIDSHKERDLFNRRKRCPRRVDRVGVPGRGRAGLGEWSKTSRRSRSPSIVSGHAKSKSVASDQYRNCKSPFIGGTPFLQFHFVSRGRVVEDTEEVGYPRKPLGVLVESGRHSCVCSVK